MSSKQRCTVCAEETRWSLNLALSVSLKQAPSEAVCRNKEQRGVIPVSRQSCAVFCLSALLHWDWGSSRYRQGRGPGRHHILQQGCGWVWKPMGNLRANAGDSARGASSLCVKPWLFSAGSPTSCAPARSSVPHPALAAALAGLLQGLRFLRLFAADGTL